MNNVAYAQHASDIVVANDNNGIIVDPELKALIPPLSEDERSGLEASIQAEGCREPVLVWGGTIVDGHNRYEICSRLGVPFRTVSKDFESRLAVKVWMRANQMSRRNLTSAWKLELQLANKEDLLEIGRAKIAANGGDKKSDGVKSALSKNDNSDNNFNPATDVPAFLKKDDPKPKHNTQKEIAKAAGVSTGQVAQAEYVRKKAPELWEKAKTEGLPVGNVYAEVKKAEKKQEREALIQKQKDDIASGAIALPAGVYEVVAMDPPWNYGREYDPDGSRIANPYPEMTQAQLLEMEPPFADDCVLFLWTTHQFIWDAKALMDKWGFTYKANLVWDKDKIGMGAWLRMQCEFCLVGIKGKPMWDNTTWRDIIREPRREHSRKPEVFYKMVEDITAGRRLDFFSREPRDGWASFGNDKDRF